MRNNRLVHVLVPGEGGVDKANWYLKPIITWFNVYQELPEALNLNAEYMFASTNESAVSVDANGVLTFKAVGTANIMVYEKNTKLMTLLEVEVLPNNDEYYVKGENGSKTLKTNLVAPALASGVDFSVALDATGKVYRELQRRPAGGSHQRQRLRHLPSHRLLQGSQSWRARP